MPSITLTEARANVDAWVAASKALAGNQAYSINGRSLSRANAQEVRDMVQYWSGIVARLERGSSGPSIGISYAKFSTR